VPASLRIVTFAAAVFLAVGALWFVACTPRDQATGDHHGPAGAPPATGVGPSGVTPAATAAGIFAYSPSNAYVTRSIDSQMGAVLAHDQASADWHWATLARFDVGAHQYVMSHGRQTATGLAADWSIRELFPSGDLGNQTDAGSWPDYYATLIGCQSGGNAFVIGQRDSDNSWFVRQVNAGGVMGETTNAGAWSHYYGVAVPLAGANQTYVYFQSAAPETSGGNPGYPWFIAELTADGRLNQTSSGYWDNYYPVTTAFAVGDQWYLFAHRPPAAGAAGAWFIRRLAAGGQMGPLSDSGAWADYFATIASFPAADGKTYLFGQNTNGQWLIAPILPGGTLGAATDSGAAADACSFVFPFAFDTLYLHRDDWMAAQAATIGPRKLTDITIPGSHDAGVNAVDYSLGNCNRLASSCNTTAQDTDIKGQLALGSRYFDVRPAILDVDDWSSWQTGHYDTSLLMGCRGEKISDIFSDVNAFFADPAHAKELAILDISHCFNVTADAGCGDAEYGVLTANIESGVDHLVKCADDCDLLDMTLDQVLALGNVIVRVEGVPSDKPHGIFSSSGADFPIYNNYSDTDNLPDMIAGQYSELETLANHRNQLFLLSWTLTQSTADAIECMFTHSSILSMAVTARPPLFGDLEQWVAAGSITPTLYPNIIYLDAFDGLGTRTAIYLNQSVGHAGK
jgi:hypothetical protein